jgi:hypothetical protein
MALVVVVVSVFGGSFPMLLMRAVARVRIGCVAVMVGCGLVHG